MANISFLLAEDQVSVEVHIHDFASPIPTEEEFKLLFESSEFGQCLFLDDHLSRVMNAFPKQMSRDEKSEEEPPPLEEPLVFQIAKKLDATLEIDVSPDLLQATMHLVTAHGGENYTQETIEAHFIEELTKELTENDTNQARRIHSIKGLKKDVIERVYNESVDAEPGTKFNEVIAEGRPPGEGTPTMFEYLVTPLQDRVLVPQERDDGSVDVRDLGEIEVVDTGDKLVRRINAKPGAPGFNIVGEVLYSKAPENLNLIAGEGAEICETDPDLLVATQEGVPIKIDNGMLVSKVLPLDQVNLAVGNIDFDGTVIVKGDVAPQMQVKATQDVVVDGFVESCTIEAGGNITVRQGVIGQKGSSNIKVVDLSKLATRLIAGRDINIRYAQAAYLEAKNDVVVGSQLLHCHTKAGERVQVGEPGQKKPKLIGGQVQAATVAAGEIGAPANSRIVIDFSDKIKALQAKIRELVKPKIENDESMEKLERLQRKLSVSDTTPVIEVHREKVAKNIEHLAAQRQQMEEQESAYEAEIEEIKNAIHVDVYGEIYPGVEFVICYEKFRVKNHVLACTICFHGNQIHYNEAQDSTKGSQENPAATQDNAVEPQDRPGNSQDKPGDQQAEPGESQAKPKE